MDTTNSEHPFENIIESLNLSIRRAYNTLGIHPTDSPDKVPMIERRIESDKSLSDIPTLRIIGMPWVAKGTSMSLISSVYHKINPHPPTLFLPQPTDTIKSVLQTGRANTQSEEIALECLSTLCNDFGLDMGIESRVEVRSNWNLLQILKSRFLKARADLYKDSKLVIEKRGLEDNDIYSRTGILSGYIKPYSLSNLNPSADGIILCLARPQNILARYNGEGGSVMNFEFLTHLYDQYIALHERLLDGILPYYVVLNMEGPYEQMHRKLVGEIAFATEKFLK